MPSAGLSIPTVIYVLFHILDRSVLFGLITRIDPATKRHSHKGRKLIFGGVVHALMHKMKCFTPP
jgi:hypothetical protein